MGVPTSEVRYTPAMPRREDNEVHIDMWWHWTQKIICDARIYKRSGFKNGERILHVMTRYFKRPRRLNLTNLDVQGGAEERMFFKWLVLGKIMRS